MNYKFKRLTWILALFAALCFDYLFWQKTTGVNVFIFVVLILLCGLIPFWLNKVSIPWTSYLLLIPIIGFAFLSCFRSESLTSVINILIIIGALVLFATTLLNGDWIRFNIQDHVVNSLKFLLNCFSGGILFFLKVNHTLPESQNEVSGSAIIDLDREPEPPDKKRTPQKWLPYFRGVLIAIPILIILTFLLTSADPIFKDRIQNLFSWFNADNLGEVIFRLVYITLIAYQLLSANYFGLFESKKIKKIKAAKPSWRPFLGFIESWIILGMVNLLFLSFVILQFTYLFGGQSNINLEGFTYSEYAVRGYMELIAVVIITLILFYVMNLITKRETVPQQRIFSCLGLLLIGLTGVILASALTRLSLYETVYGFTRLRTLTHISMIWIGLLLLAVIILEITHKMQHLAIILICLIFGFGVTVNLVNIDRFIVQQNINRTISSSEIDSGSTLDTRYLFSLSYDSIPPLITVFKDSETPEIIKEEIGAILACRLLSLDVSEKQPWYTAHFSRSRATQLLEENTHTLENYLVFGESGWLVKIDGEIKPCWDDAFDPDILD